MPGAYWAKSSHDGLEWVLEQGLLLVFRISVVLQTKAKNKEVAQVGLAHKGDNLQVVYRHKVGTRLQRNPHKACKSQESCRVVARVFAILALTSVVLS